MTPNAQLAILQALMEDAFAQAMAAHGTILTDNFAEVVSKDLPDLSQQIASAFAQLVIAREQGATEADLWPSVEKLAVSFENSFYGKTAIAVRTIGREVVPAASGGH